MEVLKLIMYLAGLGATIWWMAHIKRFADWAVDRIFPPQKKATRSQGSAARVAEELNRYYCTTETGSVQHDYGKRCA